MGIPGVGRPTDRRRRGGEIIADGLRAHPNSPTLHYELACLEALGGRDQPALAELRAALEVTPELARSARQDPDFERLRADPSFRELTAQ